MRNLGRCEGKGEITCKARLLWKVKEKALKRRKVEWREREREKGGDSNGKLRKI